MFSNYRIRMASDPMPFVGVCTDQDQMYTRVDEPVSYSKAKRGGSLICGVIQITLGMGLFVTAVVKSSSLVIAFGIHGFLGAGFSMLAGAFGIQSGRSGGKCPTIAGMVLSILGSIVLGVGFIFNIAFLSSDPDTHVYAVSRYRLEYSEILTGDLSKTLQGLMVFLCLVNLVAAIIQSALACSMVCSCCKPVNTNTVMMATNNEA